MDSSGSFFNFIKLCKALSEESSYTAKEELCRETFSAWDGDLFLVLKLLLCKQDLRVFHLGDTALCKVMATMLGVEMKTVVNACLTSGDCPTTCSSAYRAHGNDVKERSTLTIGNVDSFLDALTDVTKRADQAALFSELLEGRATADDVYWIVRLISKDLSINIGPKYALGALHPNAFGAWKKSNNLKLIVEKWQQGLLDAVAADASEGDDGDGGPSPKRAKSLSGGIVLGVPVKPMLARATKSYEDAWKRAPNMRAEIKYDGERLQLHKDGDTITAFSRNLKPVPKWKVAEVEVFLPPSCIKMDTAILDAEVLLLSPTGLPLPFGTFNVHKKTKFASATVALFVFDLLYLNGESLLDRAFDERRALLEQHLTVVPRHVLLAELHKPKDVGALQSLMKRVILEKQEGLVVKEGTQTYHPGARHFLKLKKDYLDAGAMADSADLIVLGGYYGTGKMGGLIATLLLGVRDGSTGRHLTVCKCGNGMTDAEVSGYQAAWLKLMSKCPAYEALPDWIRVDRKYMPDLLVQDPSTAPVFEVAGAEFSVSSHHTANGISIRFPRFVRERDDKDAATATTLAELQALFDASKAVGAVAAGDDDDDDDDDGKGKGEAVAAPAPKRAKPAPPKKAKPAAKTKPKKKKARIVDDDDDGDDDGLLALADDDEDDGYDGAVARPQAAPARQACKYGAACNRANPQHFKQFAHPLLVAGRAVCAYGAACTRQNPQHFRDERHADEVQ